MIVLNNEGIRVKVQKSIPMPSKVGTRETKSK